VNFAPFVWVYEIENKPALISSNGPHEKLSRVLAICPFSIAFSQMFLKVRMSKWSISQKHAHLFSNIETMPYASHRQSLRLTS
jgi:hypothetical protein